MKSNSTNPKQRKSTLLASENSRYAGGVMLAAVGRNQVAVAKETLFAQSRRTLGAPEQLLRLVLNEAEALAWQTPYPHLVFPVLATEKLQALAAWKATQQTVRRASPIFTLAE